MPTGKVRPEMIRVVWAPCPHLKTTLLGTISVILIRLRTTEQISITTTTAQHPTTQTITEEATTQTTTIITTQWVAFEFGGFFLKICLINCPKLPGAVH